MLRECLKSVVYAYKKHKISKLVTLHGSNHVIGLGAMVGLRDGSDKNDIVIGNKSTLHGMLASQSNGKIKIGDYVRIGRHVEIRSVESIEIGSHVVISTNCIITDNGSHPVAIRFRRYRIESSPSSTLNLWKYSGHSPVVIKDNAWICENSRICKGVTIGENSVVAAGSIVTKDVPANCIAAGNPAKIVKTDIDQIPDPTDCEEFNRLIAEHGKDF